MGSCKSGSDNRHINSFNDSYFPREKYKQGEQYFLQTVDTTIGTDSSINNIRDKLYLYFSLTNIINPSNMHSFSITIINNAKLNIDTYLGELEEKSGKEIQFGNSFVVYYYFHREQLLLITPKVNGVVAGPKQSIKLSDLIRNPKASKIKYNGIGDLIITYSQKKVGDSPSQNLCSSFEFTFFLRNKIFNESSNTVGIFFVIYMPTIDRRNKRALYKSQEFTLYNNTITSNYIDLPNNLLTINDDPYTPFFISLFCPRLRIDNPIGYAQISLYDLENNLRMDKPTVVYIQSNEYDNLGTVKINYDQKISYTFIDYLSKGMQINLDIAIDYTASNNDLTDKKLPLHTTGLRFDNDYEKAIESCGSIVAFYDYDQLFPVYGFGGVPNVGFQANGQVNHCFHVNFKEDPFIEGVGNIITAYRESLSKVTLAGPTFFSPVIDKVIEEVKYDMQNNREENHYYILLILTDGCINDTQQTRDKIVEASALPISIIIVGLGNADFTLMNMLDGDEEPVINSRGEKWKRDIVQFVKFEDFKRADSVNYGTDLTEEVLKEIPRQVEQYFQRCGKFYN